MSIIDKLKSVGALRRIVKKCKIWHEYMLDADVFCKYYMEESDKRKDYEYRMLMFVHNIEKGMCMPNPRPFGKEKISKLMDMIGIYAAAISTLVSNIVICVIRYIRLYGEIEFKLERNGCRQL